MSPRTTVAVIRAMGLTATYDRAAGEYRINLPGASERSAYYTPDSDDALVTARAMSARHASYNAATDKLIQELGL